MPKLVIDLSNPQDVEHGLQFLRGVQAQAPLPAPCVPAQQPAAQQVMPAPASGPQMTMAPQPSTPANVVPMQPGGPAPGTVTAEGLRARLTDLTRQLGARANEVGAIIQSYGATNVSGLSIEQLQDVVLKTEGLVSAG